jgi:hypothetical protein
MEAKMITLKISERLRGCRGIPADLGERETSRRPPPASAEAPPSRPGRKVSMWFVEAVHP